VKEGTLMTKQSLTVSTAILAALVIALAVWLVIELRSDSEGDATVASMSSPACTMAWRMMAGPGDWDPERMQSYMQTKFGRDGYEAMVVHMRSHLNGNDSEAPSGIGADWHGMMDAMMRGWNRGDWERCWGWMTDT
jgi:hypothetical protein